MSTREEIRKEVETVMGAVDVKSDSGNDAEVRASLVNLIARFFADLHDIAVSGRAE